MAITQNYFLSANIRPGTRPLVSAPYWRQSKCVPHEGGNCRTMGHLLISSRGGDKTTHIGKIACCTQFGAKYVNSS